MKRILFILFPGFVFLFVTGCVKNKNQVDSIEFKPLWVKMGDEDCVLDMEVYRPTSVESAEFSPDEKLIASVSKGDDSIRLWEADSGRQIWKKYAEDETECVTFTRDGKYFATGGEDKLVRIWNLEGEVVKQLEHVASIEGLRFSHNGNYLATGNEAGQVNIWDTKDKNPANWSSEPRYTLIHGHDQDLPNGKPEYGHSDINQVDWTEDDKYIVSASRNTQVKLWEVDSLGNGRQGLKIVYEGHHGSSKCVRLSPGDSLVASGCGRRDGYQSGFGLWDTFTGKQLAYIFLPKLRVLETVEFTPNGKYLLVGGTEFEDKSDGNTYIYKVNELINGKTEPAKVLEVHHQEYFYFSKDGSKLVSSHQDGSLRVWEVSYKSTLE